MTMRRNSGLRLSHVVAASLLLFAVHGRAEAPPIYKALSGLQAGLWEFKSKDDAAGNRSLCLSDPGAILQLRHFGQSCTRFLITNDARTTTIHYSCPKIGHGQTTVRVETPRLVQVQSQGMDKRSPFAFEAEGRRVGQCGGAGGRAR